MKKTRFLIAMLMLSTRLLYAQKMDNHTSFRAIESNHYFLLNFDNDFFLGTDRYYTQGFNFELVSPKLEKNPINYALLKRKENRLQFGLSLEHLMFTPEDIGAAEIQFGDRPFSAVVALKSFVVATDTLRKSRLRSSVAIGIIGPGAFGEELQIAYHKITRNVVPRGWQNQIANDLVFQYDVGYEKEFFRYDHYLSVQGGAIGQLGSLFTKASVQASAMAGIINAPFSAAKPTRFQLYAYLQPLATIVGYDASLQGGLFNSKSPYTIAASEVERFTLQTNYGIVLQTRTVYLEYGISYLTREFSSGEAAKWFVVKVGFRL